MKLKTMKRVPDHTLNSPRRFGVAGAILALIGVTSAVVGWQLLTPRAASPEQTTSSAPEQPVKLAMLGGDLHALTVLEDGRLIYGQHAGLQTSSDGGQTWSEPVGDGDAMGVGVAGQRIYLAGHDFLVQSADGGKSWQARGFGDLPGTDIHGFTAAPNGWLYANLAGRGLYRSTDGGAKWAFVTAETLSSMNLQSASGNPNLLYANSFDRGLIRSTDGGQRWTSVTQNLDGGLSAFAVERVTGGLIGATADGKLLTSSDAGATWQTSRAPDSLALLAISPRDAKLVYAVAGTGQVYRSSDGGATWTGR